MTALCLLVGMLAAPPAVDVGVPAVDVPGFAVAGPSEDYATRALANIEAAKAALNRPETPESCPCGADCKCGLDCPCPQKDATDGKQDPAASTEASARTETADERREAAVAITAQKEGLPALRTADVRPPHLTATIWSTGCIHGERWDREARPALEAAGWRVEVRRVAPGEATCPTFTACGSTWTGYESRAGHFARLDRLARPSCKEPLQVQPAPVARRAIGGDPRPGHWSHPGDIWSHLRQHGIPTAGLTYEQAKTAHDIAHEQGQAAALAYVGGGGYATLPAIRQRSFVPARRSASLFGRMFGACPGGGCP